MSHHSPELIRSVDRSEDTWCGGSYGLACVSANARGFLELLEGPRMPRRVDERLVCVCERSREVREWVRLPSQGPAGQWC